MGRIKGILAAGALTSLVLATAVGLGASAILEKQTPKSTRDATPVVIVQHVTATPQPVVLQPAQPAQPSFEFQAPPVIESFSGGEREGGDEREGDGDGEREGGGDGERGGDGDGEREGGGDD